MDVPVPKTILDGQLVKDSRYLFPTVLQSHTLLLSYIFEW